MTELLRTPEPECAFLPRIPACEVPISPEEWIIKIAADIRIDPNIEQSPEKAEESEAPCVNLTLADCHANDGFASFHNDQKIDEDQFLDLQRAVYNDLRGWIESGDPPRPGFGLGIWPFQGDPRRATFDTPFWAHHAHDTMVCIGDRCCTRTEVNYFAQGMWGAAANESLQETLDVAQRWKRIRYGEHPSECTYYWTIIGYQAYQRFAEDEPTTK